MEEESKRRRRGPLSLRASWKPFGIGEQRPNNFGEITRALWENRDQPGYTWRILKDGVCDGCALGTKGMRDWTLDGVHLCNVRLRLLRLNTAGAFDPAELADVSALRDRSGAQLREMGRLPRPMIRRRGDRGFSPISWEEALELTAERLRSAGPDRQGFYLTSRGTANETYYAAQKAARAIGTNAIDNAARVCHSPSTFGLKEALGVGATTCSYTDWMKSDLIVFIGSNVANNQPVATKYLHHAKREGARVAVVNPYREPGMERYWIPSIPESAVFGTKIADRFFEISVGGDVAFLTGTLRHMRDNGWIDRDFVDGHTSGFEALSERAGHAQLGGAGGRRGLLARRDARLRPHGRRGRARRAGVVDGGDPARGGRGQRARDREPRAGARLGRPGGLRADADPGALGRAGRRGDGVLLDRAAGRSRGERRQRRTAGRAVGLRGARLGRGRPRRRWSTPPTGATSTCWSRWAATCWRSSPTPPTWRRPWSGSGCACTTTSCSRPPCCVDPSDTVLLLPATTRYEVPGGVTETSTERRVILSPEIPGPRVDEARPEWEVLLDLARRVRPERARSPHVRRHRGDPPRDRARGGALRGHREA